MSGQDVFTVVVAGGGIAGLEALIALRDLAAGLPLARDPGAAGVP